jgi:hypothetical protein
VQLAGKTEAPLVVGPVPDAHVATLMGPAKAAETPSNPTNRMAAADADFRNISIVNVFISYVSSELRLLLRVCNVCVLHGKGF